MGNFLQLVLRVTNSQKYCIHLTLFSEIICCRVVLVFLVWRKVLECTFPSVLMRMWLVLVTARATLSGSGLARSSSSLDKHWRAWKYFADKILQRSSGEISQSYQEREKTGCVKQVGSLYYCVLWLSQCHTEQHKFQIWHIECPGQARDIYQDSGRGLVNLLQLSAI